MLKWNNRTCALYDCEMTQDEIEAAIRTEWDRLAKTEEADEDRVLAFCERMARQPLIPERRLQVNH